MSDYSPVTASSQSSAVGLPVAGAPPGERRDARRNRERILAAAERLFGAEGVERVSMDRIAEEAGVGKGTLYRRFGDRAGLARALLDELEREFQDALIRGPAPLGPGAPAIERLVAFGAAVLDLVSMRGDLILASEMGSVGGRFRGSIYAAHRAHVALLLREARPGCDAEYLADALLASLAAEVVLFLRTDRGMPLERLKAGFADLARAVASA